MKFVCSQASLKKFTPLLGVIALSSVAFLGNAESARAADIEPGFDFLVTQSPTSLPIPGFGLIDLIGNPIPPSLPYDTVLRRLEKCNFVAGTGTCSVPLIITELSVKSEASFPGLPGNGQIFITLDGLPSDGLITINQNGTWNATLPVRAVAKDANGLSLANFANTLTGDGTWDVNSNVFLPVGIFRGPLVPIGPIFAPEPTHSVSALRYSTSTVVPESSTVLASLVGLGAMLGLKKNKNS